VKFNDISEKNINSNNTEVTIYVKGHIHSLRKYATLEEYATNPISVSDPFSCRKSLFENKENKNYL